ncbi:MAG: hypothetical protein AB7F64_08490, partial [Gammaproteobacteria bacterium]
LYTIVTASFNHDDINEELRVLDQAAYDLINIYNHVYTVDQPLVLLMAKGSGFLDNPDPIKIEAVYLNAMDALFAYKEMKELIDMESTERKEAFKKHTSSLKIGPDYKVFFELARTPESKMQAEKEYEENFQQALKNLLTAAENGHPYAMDIIGCAMISGIIEIDGIAIIEDYPESPKIGADLLKISTPFTKGGSMLVLALYYKYIENNLEETLNCLKQCYLNGNDDVLEEIIKIFERGYTEKNTNRVIFEAFSELAANTLKDIAIEQSSPSIASILAENYLYNLSNVDEGLFWYERAIKFGVSNSTQILQSLYQDGLKSEDGKVVLEPKDDQVQKILSVTIAVLAEQGRQRRATLPLMPISGGNH